jgi:hypothetical protein
VYRIQILHSDSGLYLNTSHESDDLETLRSLLGGAAFAGPRFQIVVDDGEVHFGPTATQRSIPITVKDLARSFGVPMVDACELGLVADADACVLDEYTLAVIHDSDGVPIVRFRIEKSQAMQVVCELWPQVKFWSAPEVPAWLSRPPRKQRPLAESWIAVGPRFGRIAIAGCSTCI